MSIENCPTEAVVAGRHRSEHVGRHHTSKPHPIGENVKSGSFRMRPFIGTGRKRTGLALFC